MKLITMTDFVLRANQSPDYVDESGNKPYKETALIPNGVSLSECFRTCIRYAQFLKQPLTLGMFVPCDGDGNMLDEFTHIVDIKISSDYLQAKERVLFEDFKIRIGDGFTILDFPNGYAKDFANFKDAFSGWNIEELVKNLTGIQLTQSAIKQIF